MIIKNHNEKYDNEIEMGKKTHFLQNYFKK